MKITAKGIALLKEFEGCKLAAYLCSAGVPTIGYGHTGPDVTDGLTITKAEAETLLRIDVARFEKCVADACTQQPKPSQFDAMVCLSFNIGEGWKGKKRPGERDGFRQSSVLRLHNAGKFAESAQAFAMWNKAGGKVNAGLVKRRAKEADRYDDDLQPETIDMPQRVEGEKPLSSSRVQIGQAVAATVTGAPLISSAVSEATAGSDIFTQIGAALGPLAPYATWVGTAIVIVGMGSILYTMYARWQMRNEGRA